MENSIYNLLHNLPDDFLENKYELGIVASLRNLLSTDDEYYVANTLRGEDGEEKVRKMLAEETTLGPYYVQNLKLTKRGDRCEVDGIIFTEHKWVCLEIKNYFGVVEITPQETWKNGVKMRNNPMYRTSKMKEIVEEIVRGLNINVQLEFIMVFTDPNCDVRRMDPSFPIGYLTSNQMLHYFKALDRESRSHRYSDQDFAYWQNRLSYYTYKFVSERINRKNFNWSNFVPGLACPECKHVALDIKKYQCHCRNCGCNHHKEYVLVTNIIDYCLIHETRVFSISGIRNYIGDELERKFVSRIIRKYFRVKDSYSRKHYIL